MSGRSWQEYHTIVMDYRRSSLAMIRDIRRRSNSSSRNAKTLSSAGRSNPVTDHQTVLPFVDDLGSADATTRNRVDVPQSAFRIQRRLETGCRYFHFWAG